MTSQMNTRQNGPYTTIETNGFLQTYLSQNNFSQNDL
jgi:hypothetical protein